MKLNKITLYSFIALLSALSIISCKKDDVIKTDELRLVTTLKSDDHTIELYTESGKLTTGYNEVHFQVKNEFGAILSHQAKSWTPVMDMGTMTHSCPASNIVPLNGNPMTSVGYIIFNMASSEMGDWKLEIEYAINDVIQTATGDINVEASPRRVVQGFMGTDSVNYVIALVEPRSPKEGTNVMKAALYKRETHHIFTPIENYKILIDPRMPGMGNHSSPNNVDLSNQGKGIYNGKINFSMTGYWKINLQVEDASGEIIKGEAITEEHESSSIFLEVEF